MPLPQHIVAHGWWTISDKKISKSDPATKVNPVKIANDITIDGLRFYLLKETSLDRDGNLDYNHLIEVLNTYLANKIGNLVNRTVSMVNKYLEGNVKELKGEVHYHFKQSVVIKQEALNMRQQVIKQMRGFAPSEALDEIIKYVDLLNGYIDITMPWKLAKDNEKEKLEELFAILVEGIRWMSSYLNIFLPDISSLINKQFYFKNDELPTEFVLDRKITTEHADIIYQRIDNKSGEQLIKKWQGVECV